MIQEKIRNGEGLLVIDIDGIETEILASEFNQKTDPQWDKTIADYKDRTDFLYNEYKIDKNNILSEIKILIQDIENLKLEFESKNLKELYNKLKIEEKRFDVYSSNRERRELEEKRLLEDPIIKNLENQIYSINNSIWEKIKDKKNIINEKSLSIQKLKDNLDKKMIEISEDLKATRKAQNTDYKLWQSYPIIWKPTKNDYKKELKDGLIKENMTKEEIENPDNYNLILLSAGERIEKAKEKKKKQIAEILIAKYPDKQIKGELASILTGLESEIDLIDNENEIKNYQIDFSVIE